MLWHKSSTLELSNVLYALAERVSDMLFKYYLVKGHYDWCLKKTVL